MQIRGGKGKNGLSILTVKSSGLMSSVASVAPTTVKFNAVSASAAAIALIVFCRFISVSFLRKRCMRLTTRPSSHISAAAIKAIISSSRESSASTVTRTAVDRVPRQLVFRRRVTRSQKSPPSAAIASKPPPQMIRMRFLIGVGGADRVGLPYCATHCEGRCQELNGDLTWRGVYELARPPITASPHLVLARSRRYIVSFPARDAAAQVSAMTMDYFS
jgi:hypothetical protein